MSPDPIGFNETFAPFHVKHLSSALRDKLSYIMNSGEKHLSSAFRDKLRSIMYSGS